jgi:CTP synthase
LPESERAKIALFCNVPTRSGDPGARREEHLCRADAISCEGLDVEVLRAFGIDPGARPNLSRWDDIMDRQANPEGEVTIGVVGKYVGLPDAYKSLHEALTHGGIANRVKVNIRWLDAELFEKGDDIAAKLEPMHGILVPGGFGERGSEGKIAGVRFARERNVPFFGICLGMQMACIEGARNTGHCRTPPPPNSATASRWSA